MALVQVQTMSAPAWKYPAAATSRRVQLDVAVPGETVELSQAPPAERLEKAERRALLKEALDTALEASHQFAFGPAAQFACRKLKGILRTGPARVPDNELGPLPPSTITRPVLFVPGFHTPMHRFDPLVEKLTENQSNGGQPYYVRQGAFYLDRECTQPAPAVDSDARVFVTIFSQPNLPPDEGAVELRQNLESIETLTVSPKVDVAAFSLGGLSTRHYLDEGGDRVGKLQFIGTPNHGSALARMSLGLLDGKDDGYDVDLLLSIKNLGPEDRRALEWLEPSSPRLAGMNSRWSKQRAAVESVRHFGSDAKMTVGNKFWLQASRGDGIVTKDSLHLDGMPVRLLEDKKYALHGNLITSPELYDELQDHFGWR